MMVELDIVKTDDATQCSECSSSRSNVGFSDISNMGLSNGRSSVGLSNSSSNADFSNNDMADLLKFCSYKERQLC